MKNKNLTLVLFAIAAVLVYLFTRRGTTSGFIAPTSGNLPIAGSPTANASIGAPLSLLPPNGIAPLSNSGGSSAGAGFSAGPPLPPGYDPNNPATYPDSTSFLSQDFYDAVATPSTGFDFSTLYGEQAA